MSTRSLVQLARERFRERSTPLRTPAVAVEDFGEDFQRFIEDLIDTLCAHEIAVGLAAPQIGVGLRAAVINVSPGKTEPTLAIVNPGILSLGGKKDRKRESCMSLPHFRGEVERRTKIEVEYQDRTGDRQRLEADGFLARVLQHEIDHLDGVLYLDRMKDPEALEKVDFFR